MRWVDVPVGPGNGTGSVSDLNFDKRVPAKVQVAHAPRTVPPSLRIGSVSNKVFYISCHSSTEISACRRMLRIVPTASSRCLGTMAVRSPLAVRLTNFTWLPL